MPRSKAVAKKSSEKPSKKNLHSQKIARKSAPVTTGVKKRRFRPGTVALREIKRYQKTTDMLIQKAPFQRKGTSIFIQSEECWEISERFRTKRAALPSVSRHRLFWLCKKLAKLQWSTCSRMLTCALSTPKEWPSCLLILLWPVASEATNTDSLPYHFRYSISYIISQKLVKNAVTAVISHFAREDLNSLRPPFRALKRSVHWSRFHPGLLFGSIRRNS